MFCAPLSHGAPLFDEVSESEYGYIFRRSEMRIASWIAV